jgi:hypothetical protein
MRLNANRGKFWQVTAAVLGSLGLSVAIVGCGSSTAPTKEKMTGGQMKENKMHEGKMEGDHLELGKMGSPKMEHDKMDSGKKQ